MQGSVHSKIMSIYSIMIKNIKTPASRGYKAPWSELLETLPEEILCVSGDGDIDPVTGEEWGTF